jgi:hypothetical protein
MMLFQRCDVFFEQIVSIVCHFVRVLEENESLGDSDDQIVQLVTEAKIVALQDVEWTFQSLFDDLTECVSSFSGECGVEEGVLG